MLTLVSNNLKLFFKDRKAVILTFMLPIGLTSLFMVIFGGTGSRDGMSELDLGVCDLVQNNATQQTVAGLDSNKLFRVLMVPDTAELIDKVHKGKVDAGVIMSPQKGESVHYTLVLDGSNEVQNSMLKPMLNLQLMGSKGGGYKTMIMDKIKEDYPGVLDSEMVAFNEKFEGFANMDPGKMMGGEMETHVIKPESGIHPGAIQAIAGTALMTLLFAVAGMGAGIIEEKEKGTLRRILISPIRPLDFMFAKWISSIVISFMQLLGTLLFCWLVFELPVFDRPFELALLIVFTAAACSSFGILLAGICDSRKQIESLSTVVVLLMSLLGGSMIPAFVMPPLMQKFSMLTINYWSSEGFFDLFYRNVETSYFLVKIGVLLLYSLALIGISILLFRKKLSRIA